MEREREQSGSLLYLSKSLIQSYPKDNQSTVHLTPWDLTRLSIEYIQFGILLPKPSTPLDITISHLKSSLSQSLNHFFPLAGRLSTINHDTMPPTISILVDCGNQGAEFIVASAEDVTVFDIVRPLYVPSILKSFFPLNDAIGRDGHSLPLLSVQVTEILDGVFIGCSLNHSIGDGASFWDFLNSWSEISRNDSTDISSPPIFDRTISELKVKANSEMADADEISSLQALLAHVWKFIVRAWKLNPDQEASFYLPLGNRSRIKPPLPDAYFGISISGCEVKASAGEVMSQGLGCTAWKLNRAVASLTNEIIKNWLDSWVEHPFTLHPEMYKAYTIYIMNSPRFNVYGNDFGWGRRIAVRSGSANKLDVRDDISVSRR
ncbi:uncharacterized protein A4U43_C02F14560 [Asparagus officinalis]|uniref:Acetyltransferase n=1 Tax=Asparagus officinalis TaxID=4686 RepID=A0A5P1FNB8_ASPOF|nr:uncharacterized protein A4U43_C02F14560 [Asparagus officinalis]